MNTTKIEWCDDSWNPVTGCYHGCDYCYARRIAERFGLKPLLISRDILPILELDEPHKDINGKINSYPMSFAPTFHRYRLEEPARKMRPRTIFVCSMADLFGFWVPTEWIKDVFSAIHAAPQHRYLFLTKNPNRYHELLLDGTIPVEENIWLGATITGNAKLPFDKLPSNHNFVSIEPLLEPITWGGFHFKNVQWVIIGAETGNRKDKVTPDPAWIEDIVSECDFCGIPVFMKNSLLQIVGEDRMRRDFPW